MKNIWILPLFAILALSACKNDSPASTTEVDEDLGDFPAFYKRFHQDSLYQMDHIVFPLKGLPREVDSLTAVQDDFYWQREEWIMHRPFDFEMSDFERHLQKLTDNLIQEKILHTLTGAIMTRRYAKLSDGEWNLIYYADLNYYER